MMKNSIAERLLFSIMLGAMLPLLFFGYGGGLILVIGLLAIPSPILYFCCERWLPKRTILKHVLFFGYWFVWFSFSMYEYNYAPEGAVAGVIAIGISMFSAASYLAIFLTKPSRSF